MPVGQVVNTLLENISVNPEIPELEQSIGERLAQCRRLLSVVIGQDLTQDEFAAMAGFAAGVMSHWEKGHKNPSEATMEKVVALMQQYGVGTITVPWIRYGIGEGIPKIGRVPEPSRQLREAKPTERLERSRKKPDRRAVGDGKGRK